MRKSFILHKDSLGILSKLDDNQAGKLFKAIAEYCESGEINCDFQTELLLFPFQKQFDRDNESYQKTLERNRINGSKGGRPKTKDIPDKPSGLNGLNNKPKKADSDSKSDSKSDSDSKNKEIKDNGDFDLVWSMYEKKGNRKTSLLKFNKLSDSNKKLIIDHIPKYVSSTPDKQFRKNLETYINQECWNDEISEVSNNGRQEQARFETTSDRYARQSRELEARENATRLHKENPTFIQNNG